MRRPNICHVWACATLLVSFALSPATPAQSQTDLVTPTGWHLRDNNTLTDINQLINAGNRMVDFEPRVSLLGSLRYSGAFVQNSGDYAKGWWWYVGQTPSSLSSLMSQNNARLIDIEPYYSGADLRYAAVMIPNTGADAASGHGWRTDMTGSALGAWVNANPTRRIVDIQTYVVSGATRYAFAWVSNTGSQQSAWWLLFNTTPQTISSFMTQNNVRLVDLEHHDATGRMTAIMAPSDGNAWYWFHGLASSQEVLDFAVQYSCRVIDFERYRDGNSNTRYSAILRRNANDLTINAVGAMRSELPLGVDSGLLLEQISGSGSTLASNRASDSFEPASLIKTAHHFTSLRRVRTTSETLTSSVTERTGLNGSCPTGTNPTARLLRDVLRSMMEQSSNTATEAIRARYGTASIESTMASFGAPGIQLNHTLGCGCNTTENQGRLVDFARIHEVVASGALGEFEDEFYDYMLNGTEFGSGGFGTASVLSAELNASSLTSSERSAFLGALRLAHKGGAYTCILSGVGEYDRSRGAYVSLPFRSGCGVINREYFIGAWVNRAPSSTSADRGLGVAIQVLFRDRVRAAIDSWESANCTHFLPYCSANPNSTGQIGQIEGVGSPYISQNNLVIRGTSVPTNVFGLLVVSTTPGFTPGAGGSEGNLCLGGTIGRYQSQVQGSGSAGTLSLPINLNSIPAASTTLAVVQGQSLYFQWWHRDIGPSGAPSSNYTRGLRASFL